ncbi:hypothetical protein ACKWTF_007086 [Chironomus riparius]
MKFVFLLTFVCVFGVSQAFWTNCPGSVPGLDLFESPQCSGDRCRATRGEIFYGKFWFHTAGAYNELRSRATAFIFGIGVNLPMTPPHDDLCNLIQFPNGTLTSCPTIPNQQYLVEFIMEIPQIFPTMRNTRVQGDLFNGNDRVICLQILADLL